MRYADRRTIVAGAYVGLVFLAAVGLDSSSGPLRTRAFALIVACASVAAGLVVARWWALLLPFAGVALAPILGAPNGSGEVWAWLGLLFWSPVLIGLVLLGLIAGYLGRLAYRRRAFRV